MLLPPVERVPLELGYGRFPLPGQRGVVPNDRSEESTSVRVVSSAPEVLTTEKSERNIKCLHKPLYSAK